MIGIILCREQDRTTVEYALRDTTKPVGVAEWRSLSLPSPDDLAAELTKGERP